MSVSFRKNVWLYPIQPVAISGASSDSPLLIARGLRVLLSVRKFPLLR